MGGFGETFKRILLLAWTLLLFLTLRGESAVIDRNSSDNINTIREDTENDPLNIFSPVNITVMEASINGIAASLSLDDHSDSGQTEEEEDFRPIYMPRDFSSFDIMPPDGFVSLQELVTVTGAEENAEQALADSDLNGIHVFNMEIFLF